MVRHVPQKPFTGFWKWQWLHLDTGAQHLSPPSQPSAPDTSHRRGDIWHADTVGVAPLSLACPCKSKQEKKAARLCFLQGE